MNQIIKNEIKELFLSFDKTNNFYEKEYTDTLLERLSRVFDDDLEIKKMHEIISEKMNMLSFENICYSLYRKQRIDQYVEINKDFFYENIIAPDTFNKMSAKSIVPLSDENIAYILETFFMSVSEDIYLFYKQIMDEGRIINGFSNEIAFTSLNNSNTIIFVKGLRDLMDMLVLVHEIGHAYYFNLNGVKVGERDNIEFELKEEIPAKIMEMKFINFLNQNGVYEPSTALENLFDYIYYRYGKNENKFEGLKYVIASDIAKTVSNNIDIDEYYKHIYDASIHKLVLESAHMKSQGKRYFK